MTIVDACIQVLKDARGPLTADQILAEIQKRGIYTFKAKDPSGMVRDALRRRMRASEPSGLVSPTKGTYALHR
jgi:HB1, ASXL, restriction endonuclease HTH domain